MKPNNFIYIYGINPERRILDKILYEVDNCDIPRSLNWLVVATIESFH
jgi:hypothetical protein